jgi:hypothetical protein
LFFLLRPSEFHSFKLRPSSSSSCFAHQNSIASNFAHLLLPLGTPKVSIYTTTTIPEMRIQWPEIPDHLRDVSILAHNSPISCTISARDSPGSLTSIAKIELCPRENSDVQKTVAVDLYRNTSS